MSETDPGPASLAELEARLQRDFELLVMPPAKDWLEPRTHPEFGDGARRRGDRRRHVGPCGRVRAQMPRGALAAHVRPRAGRFRRPVGDLRPHGDVAFAAGAERALVRLRQPHLPRLVRGAVRPRGLEQGVSHPAPAMDGLSALVPARDRRADRERDRAHRYRRRRRIRRADAALGCRHAQARGAPRRAGERPRRARRRLYAAQCSAGSIAAACVIRSTTSISRRCAARWSACSAPALPRWTMRRKRWNTAPRALPCWCGVRTCRASTRAWASAAPASGSASMRSRMRRDGRS